MQNFNVTSASSGPPERYSGTDRPSFLSNLQSKSMKNYQAHTAPFFSRFSQAILLRFKVCSGLGIISNMVLMATILFALPQMAVGQSSNFSYGFEATPGVNEWSQPIRVASGTNGITAASGSSFYGLVPTAASPTQNTRFGGYNSIWPCNGYKTSIKIYLDVDAGFTNDTRMAYTSAINKQDGTHRRDFVFAIGFYNDGVAPGTGNRFVASADNAAPGWPKNPGRSPQVIATTSGWYTFEHSFENNAGVLRVVMTVYNSSDTPVGTWTLSDPSDLIATIVGGNRYGWIQSNSFSPLAVDDITLTVNPGNLPTSFTDFESFANGTVNYKGPGCTVPWNGYTIPSPYGSLWTTGDEWGQSAGSWDQEVKSDGGNKVWRISNAVTSGGFSNQPCSPSSLLVAGETSAALNNYRGTNNAIPLSPPGTRYTASSKYFHGGFKFKSATGAAQPGLTMTINPAPRQSNYRMSFISITDNGSTGFNLNFIQTNAGGTFSSSTPIATGLSYASWHELNIYIEFVDGLNGNGSGNDIVILELNGSVIHVGTTWETYYNSIASPTSPSPIAVDALMFRLAGTAQPSVSGNGFYVDDVEYDNVTPPAIPARARVYADGAETVLLSGHFFIQDAINAASNGNFIRVDAGTYDEVVTVNKSLTLRGANQGIAGNAGRGAESILDGNNGAHPGFVVTSNNVTIDGFKVQNCGAGLYESGIYINSSGCTIKNNILFNNAKGLYPSNTGPTTVEYNLFDANNRPGPGGAVAIYAFTTNSLSVLNNEFKGQTSNSVAIFDGGASHINLVFNNNYLHDNDPGSSAIYAANINGGEFGYNHITNGLRGIKVAGGNSNINIHNNTISGTVQADVMVNTDFGANSSIEIHDNSLTSAVSILNDDNSTVPDATCNSYGTLTPAAKITGTGSVDYCPWLTDFTDDSPSQGFQPVDNSCNGTGGPGGVVTNTTTGNLYCSIQVAINAASPNDVITASAGTYAENLTLTKQLTINGAQSGNTACGRSATESIITAGAGTTILMLQTGSAGSVINGFTFSGAARGIESNSGPLDNLIIKNNRFVGFTGSGVFLNDPGINITVDQNSVDGTSKVGAGDLIHLDTDGFPGFYLTNNCITNGPTATGFFVDGNHNVGPSTGGSGRIPVISGNTITLCNTGMNLGTRAFGSLLTPNAGTISSNTFGNNNFDGLQGGMQNVLISQNTFSNNGRSGLALTSFGNLGADRGTQNTLIQNNFFFGNIREDLFMSATQAAGTMATNAAHINSLLSTKAITYTGTEVVNVTCNWFGTTTAAGVAAKIDNPSNSLVKVPWLSSGVDAAPGTPGFQPSVACGTSVSITAVTPTHVHCNETTGAIQVSFIDGDATFDIAWSGPSSGSYSPVSSGYVIPSLAAGNYTITVTSANGTTDTETATVLYLPVTNVTDAPDTYYATIQAAIDAADPGDVINVCAGTYLEDVIVNKANLTVSGAGAATTMVSGPIGGGGATFQVAAAGVIIEGFTITREGNNTTDWLNGSLNFAGVAIQGQTVNAIIRNNTITGNRTGIDINNSNGNTIYRNNITFNRTGLIFRNQTDNTSMTENSITDNWTVGVLFLDGSNVGNPIQSAINSNFNNNKITGNWYGDVEDRQSGGSLPAPGTNIKNFDCNWYGSAAEPTKSNVCCGEPGYAVQIPVLYGGSAVAPGGQPKIKGSASANIDYISWLVNGMDNEVGTFGFQPVPGPLNCSGTPVTISIASTTDVSCALGGNNGAVTTTTNAGTAPYTYLWSNGAITANISGLTAGGNYTVTVTDVNGSTGTAVASVLGYLVRNVNTNVEYTTIQAAVNAASPGNEIEVCPGTFNENVLVNKQNLKLVSTSGNAVTTIQGSLPGGNNATVGIASGTNGVQIGETGKGFTIIGFDGTGSIEAAALYLLGNGPTTGIKIEGNEIRANGDHGLLADYNASINGIVINNNMFTGKTFTGAEPGGCGFGTQFDPGNNVPRQLVTLGGGAGVTNSMNITFTNNMVTGTSGGYNTGGACEQGNNLVTIDVIGAEIRQNTFNGTATSTASSLRTRGQSTSISCNYFESDNLGTSARHIFFGSANPFNGTAAPATLAGIASGNAFPDGGAYLAPNNGTSWILYKDMAQATTAAAIIGAGQTAVAASTTLNCPVLNVQTTELFPTIQAAINDPETLNGHTIMVPAGTYAENVVVSKSLTINGPKVGIDACTTRGTGEAIIMAALGSTATTAGTGSTLISVTAPNVTIDGFTIDGDNMGITNPFTAFGVNPDVDNGIDASAGGLTVQNNIIQNIFNFGIAAGTNAGTPYQGVIKNNKIQRIPYWAAILLWNNYYADVQNNCVIDAWRGVQTNNFHLAAPTPLDVKISNNTFTLQSVNIMGDANYDDVTGILVNLHYQGASTFEVKNNTVSNSATSPNRVGSNGIDLWSIQSAVGVNVEDNFITGFQSGVDLWNCPTTNTINIKGGSITGSDYGVFVNNYDGYNSNAASSSYVIDNVAIINPTTYGVYVKDNTSNTNNATVFAEIKDVTINNSTNSTGVFVSGADAGANIHNNTISGGLAGISANGTNTTAPNALTIELNTITNAAQVVMVPPVPTPTPTVGISLTNITGGPAATVSNNNITGPFYGYVGYNINTSPVTTISGGLISLVMQGTAFVNTLGGPVLGSNVGVSGVTMNNFTGTSANPANNFHAGIYTFTTSGTTTSNGINLSVNNATISGTGNHSQASGGIYLADFSGGTDFVQTVTVNNSTIFDNDNRGVDARGKVSLALTNSTLTNNGDDAYGIGGNDGFTIIAQRDASVTAENNFITLPMFSTTKAFGLFTGLGTTNQITANNNSILFNDNNVAGSKSANSDPGTGSINATCNWWGVSCAADVAALISGVVTYNPFLGIGTDFGGVPTDGFQPVTGACTGAVTAAIAGVTTLCEPGHTSVLTGSASGGYGTKSYDWSSATPTNVSLSPLDEAVTTATSILQGTSILTLTVTDENLCSDTETVVFTVTNPAEPTYTIGNSGADITGNFCNTTLNLTTDPTNCGATRSILKPVWMDNCSAVTATITGMPYIDNGAYIEVFFPKGNGSVVNFIGQDIYNNTTTCTLTVNVTDDDAPVFSNVPANVTINVPSGNCSQVITWTPPTVFENCPGVVVTSNYSPGAVIIAVPGVSTQVITVTYTATDAAAVPNVSTVSFTITLNFNCIPAVELSMQMPTFTPASQAVATGGMINGVFTVKNLSTTNATHELTPQGNVKVLVALPSSNIFSTSDAELNTDWDITYYPALPTVPTGMLLFTLKTGISIPPLGSKTIILKYTATGTTGQTARTTGNLIKGSGGDVDKSNNNTLGNFSIN